MSTITNNPLFKFKFNRQHKFKRLQNTLMLAFLAVSLTPLTVTALFFLHSHSKDLQEQSTSHLISVRDTKQQQIIDYLSAKESEVMGFVRSELAYASGGRFYGLVNAFQRLGKILSKRVCTLNNAISPVLAIKSEPLFYLNQVVTQVVNVIVYCTNVTMQVI